MDYTNVNDTYYIFNNDIANTYMTDRFKNLCPVLFKSSINTTKKREGRKSGTNK